MAILMAEVVAVQGFRSAEEVQRFSDMMDEMCYIVATKHSGSLKVRQRALILLLLTASIVLLLCHQTY